MVASWPRLFADLPTVSTGRLTGQGNGIWKGPELTKAFEERRLPVEPYSCCCLS